jgi:methyl-accepting chemotaxis protein
MDTLARKFANIQLTPLILGVFLSSLLISALLILWLFHEVNSGTSRMDVALDALSNQTHSQEHAKDSKDALVDLAKSRNDVQAALVTFKVQVQEWKNTLLRGSDPKARDKYWKAFNEEAGNVRALIATIQGRANDPAVEQVLKYFDSAHVAMSNRYKEAFTAFEQSEGKDVAAADKLVKGMDRPPTAALDSLVGLYGNELQQYAEQTKAQVASTQRHILLAAILSAMVLIGSLLFVLHVLDRFTLKPLAHAVALLEDMAQGNLTVTATSETNNEAGRLLNAATRAAASLRSLLQNSAKGFQELTASANQLQGVSQNLDQGATHSHQEIEAMRQRTEAVNQQVQSVAAATEEMGVCIQEIAQNAQSAATQSTTAASEAESVTRVLGEVSDASQKIEEILTVIQRIAEQTHLLALNSSIEAARAGEAGKGFNVVAHEIKELSHSTSEATGQIQQRIITLRQSVTGMSQSMDHLRSEVLSMRDRIGAIATAIEEQTNTTREIGRNVETTAKASQSIEEGARRIEGFTSTTKAQSADARAAAEMLQGLSHKMTEAMRSFQI